MANLQESATWEPGIFQNEADTRWSPGPDGGSNRQAKQLANRTAWLKQFADELAAARGGKANINERLDMYDVFDPENVAGLFAFASMAFDLAGLANREGVKTINQRLQTGVTLITNRGVISGCTVSKSTNAVRNLSVAPGSFFLNGMEIPNPGETNGALVPSNPGTAAQTCYAYLFIDTAGKVQFTTTPFGEPAPDGGLALYRVTVPVGSTETSDPNLASVTLTDVRRFETGYPIQVNSIAYAAVALPYTMIDSDYLVLLDIQSAKGGLNQRGTVYVGDKAANGFKIYLEGSIDSVSVRWIAVKLHL
jgi:hypothetical protein